MSEENKSPLYGKPWTTIKNCKTYEEAFAEVQQLLNSNQKYQTKIRRRPDETYTVKVRSLELPERNNEKKKRKAKKGN